MTDPTPDHQELVLPFPEPGPLLRNRHRELDLSATGTDLERRLLNHLAHAKPWDPATIEDPRVRAELWAWLDAVATWINHEHAWDPADFIPGCWPHHPHLVRDLAVLADTRRRAGLEATSDPLDHWQTYRLPAFVERMHRQLRSHCAHTHHPWPAAPRHHEHSSNAATTQRTEAFRADTSRLEADTASNE